MTVSVAQRTPAWWRAIARWSSTYEADEALAAQFRYRQLQAVLRLTPVAMAANLLNATLVAATFHASPWAVGLWPWCALIALTAFRGLHAWARARKRQGREIASPRALRRAVLHAAWLSALWAWVPLALLAGGTHGQQLLAATITTGMICAGGFVLATVPLAGSIYITILGAACAIALLTSHVDLAPVLSVLLLIYCLVVLASVWSTARLFGARMMAEAEAARQNEVVGLLLRDFEESASDVLWEIGADGKLCHVSARLEAMFGIDAATLAATPMLELLRRFTPDQDDARNHLRDLRTLIAAGAPFRDQPLAGLFADSVRWWSLSAKPLLDECGRCQGWRGVATDITAAHAANRQLTWLAHNDTLTGLRNRHQFRAELQQWLSEAHSPGDQAAVLCIDLDHFKRINDTLGHAAGDALLREVGRRLLTAARRSDTAARLGGDEFAILQRHVGSPAEVERLAARLVESLNAPCQVGDAQVSVRASIGIARLPHDGTTVDMVLHHADLALYAAKGAGRGAARFFEPEMAASTRRRRIIEQALRNALALGQLRLVFQPQVTLPAQRVIGLEALLRWRHPALGEVPPAEFVPIAEETGMMVEIGGWVLEEACRQAARWPGALTVAINVSPVQVMAGSLVERATEAARIADVAPERVEIEITESALLNEGHAAADSIHALHARGFRLALDDFGTGYSALAYLRRYRFNTLKIDSSFVRELLARGDARAIVKMIVGLGRTLNLQTVAEGVEEPAQASVLSRYGCASMQGYLVSRPLEAEEVPEFLRDWSPRASLHASEAATSQPIVVH